MSSDALRPILTHWLVLAGILNVAASVLHLLCIVAGPRAYELLGAGPMMVRMASAGHWYPNAMAIIIAAILFGFAYYAFAGAGLLPRPPMLRFGLIAVTAIFLIRGLALVPILLCAKPDARIIYIAGAGGSIMFWIFSSLVCLMIGGVFLAGTIGAWARL